jgi:hypothetical protein
LDPILEAGAAVFGQAIVEKLIEALVGIGGGGGEVDHF